MSKIIKHLKDYPEQSDLLNTIVTVRFEKEADEHFGKSRTGLIIRTDKDSDIHTILLEPDWEGPKVIQSDECVSIDYTETYNTYSVRKFLKDHKF